MERLEHPDDAKILAELAIIEALIPWACPGRFGDSLRYTLEEIMGGGREAVVYSAIDRQAAENGHDPRVAIKVYPPFAKPGRRAPTGVDSVGVAPIVESGVMGQCAYVVYRLIEGEPLSRYPRPIPARRAARIMADVARGVQALHRRGYLHGDLKPANVVVDRHGRPFLIDYDGAPAHGSAADQVLGTLSCAAPERLDPACVLSPDMDVYSLGAMLYAVLTDRGHAGTTDDEIQAFLTAGRQPQSPGIEPDLDAICLRALSREPTNRHDSPAAFAEDLDRWRRRLPIAWREPTALRRARLLVARRPLVTGLATATALAALLAPPWILASSASKLRRERDRLVDDHGRELARLSTERATDVARLEGLYQESQASGRELVRTLVGFVSGNPSTQRDTLPPVLAWMATTSPDTLGGLVVSSSRQELADLLQTFVVELQASGRGQHSDAMAAAWAHVYYLCLDQRWTDAARAAAETRRQVESKLSADDPLVLGLEVMEQIAGAMLGVDATSAETMGDALARLNQLRERAARTPGLTQVSRLCDATIKALQGADAPEPDARN